MLAMKKVLSFKLPMDAEALKDGVVVRDDDAAFFERGAEACFFRFFVLFLCFCVCVLFLRVGKRKEILFEHVLVTWRV